MCIISSNITITHLYVKITLISWILQSISVRSCTIGIFSSLICHYNLNLFINIVDCNIRIGKLALANSNYILLAH